MKKFTFDVIGILHILYSIWRETQCDDQRILREIDFRKIVIFDTFAQ